MDVAFDADHRDPLEPSEQGHVIVHRWPEEYEGTTGFQICGRSRDAKNPEGVLAEAFTLSGFSTLLTLRPRRTGLPARSQSHLSVTSTPIWSCLQVGSATIGLPFFGEQVERQMNFRELALFFATRGSGLSPGNF